MFQQFLSDSPLTVWPLLAFALFFTTFLVVCVYVLAGLRTKSNFDHVAHLPLEDDGERHGGGSAR